MPPQIFFLTFFIKKKKMIFFFFLTVTLFTGCTVFYGYSLLSPNNKHIAILLLSQCLLMVACIANSFWNLLLKDRLDDVQTELLVLKSTANYNNLFFPDLPGSKQNVRLVSPAHSDSGDDE